jgi:glutathione-regulated potassium-efflux system ancillary protein KefG
MPEILVVFAHPALEKSRVHRRLLRSIPDLPGLTLNDLYEHYPDYDVDIRREQLLLRAHELIVFQHPFYWYSVPPLLKQWQDLVLEHGWAYGSRGTALRGKRTLHVISTGGTAAAYQHRGYNHFTMRELLAPLEQTARLCGMEFLPPFVIHGTHRLNAADLDEAADEYRRFLVGMHDGTLRLDPDAMYANLPSVPEDHRSGEVRP